MPARKWFLEIVRLSDRPPRRMSEPVWTCRWVLLLDPDFDAHGSLDQISEQVNLGLATAPCWYGHN
jgi:hypothetical protein